MSLEVITLLGTFFYIGLSLKCKCDKQNELVESTRGLKLQLADAFPWACGEPTSSQVQRYAPNASLLLAKAVLRYGSRSLLVVSPDQADPSGATSFRFNPTFIV